MELQDFGTEPNRSKRREGLCGLKNRLLTTALTAPILTAVCGEAIGQIEESAGAAANREDIEEIVITRNIIFTYNDAFGATKMGLPLKDTPQSISVVTGDVIEFASLNTFNDFYKLDASGGTSHAIDGFPRNYYRGFRQQGNNAIRVDGFRMPGDIDLDLAAYDRFEVLKGPTSTLYGQNSIGGTLNAVSKVPLGEFAADFQVEAASFDFYRADVDITGPLFGSDEWSYRLVAGYQDSGSFLDFAKSDQLLIAPSVQWQPGDQTDFIFRVNYQRHDDRYHFAPALQLADEQLPGESVLDTVLRAGLEIADFPRSRWFGMPWHNGFKDALFVQTQGTHVFDNGWTLRGNLQYNRQTADTDAFFVAGPFNQEGFAYFASVYGDDAESEVYAAEVNLFGEVEAFGRDHTLFFGIDYADITDNEVQGSEVISFGFENSSFNVFTPDYDAVPAFQEPDDYLYLYDEVEEQSLFGATVQLIVNPTDRLSLLVGGRLSHDKLTEKERGGEGFTLADLEGLEFEGDSWKFTEFVLQTGAVYEITDQHNFYVSYGQTFDPSTDEVFNEETGEGELIAPEEGRNYEVGVKGDVTDNLSYSVAAFHMVRTNISQADIRPEIPRGFSIPIGTQRSRGVEFSLQGELMPGWNIFGSLAYLDAEFSEGEFKGLQPPNAPKFGLSVFMSYEVLEGDLEGLGFGLGVVHKSGRENFDEDWTADATEAAGGVLTPVNFDFGAFTEVDARIFYNWENWRVFVAASNLFNEKYFSPSFFDLDFAVHVNPPRVIKGGIGVSF